MMASSRGRDRSSPRDGRGFGRIGCLLHQAEKHAIMNRAETEDGAYASARNRKLLAGLGLKPGENEYAEPALNPCQTTAYAFFTGDELLELLLGHRDLLPSDSKLGWSRFRGLAGADPGSALQRGQGAARQDIQDGGALAATLADHRRQRGDPLGRPQGTRGTLFEASL